MNDITLPTPQAEGSGAEPGHLPEGSGTPPAGGTPAAVASGPPAAGKTFQVGLSADGAELVRMLALLGHAAQSGGAINLVAVACPEGERPDDLPEGTCHYPDSEALLTAHPELDVLLTERPLSHPAPPGLLVFQGGELGFLLALAGEGAEVSACHAELARSRLLLESVIDEVQEDILLLDREGRIVDCNKNVYAKRGKTKGDYVGFYVWEALDEEENLCKPPEYDCPLSKTMATGKAAEAMYTSVDEDGRLRYTRVYTYPIFSDGKLTHVAEMRRDISRRTNMEKRLQQSERLAAIGELSTYIAHEIRNPLFAIAGFANTLLRNKSLDDVAREKVKIILEESARLDDILKSILNFTRPTTARSGEVDLTRIVDEVLAVMRIGCENQGIKLVLERDPNLALAKGDTELVKQSFINLVKNAMEAMPEGGTLTVRTGMDWDHIYLQVEDSGQGIPKDNLQKVFNPFFSTKEKGSGLGLAMIKKIFDDLGGEVRLESTEGKGTRVTLYLPPLPVTRPERREIL